jgi:hypothetical protein
MVKNLLHCETGFGVYHSAQLGHIPFSLTMKEKHLYSSLRQILLQKFNLIFNVKILIDSNKNKQTSKVNNKI